MTPNPYPAPAPASPPKPNRTPIILGVVGLALLCLCGVPMGFVAWSASLPQSGVLAGNELDKRTKELIAKRVSLQEGEEIVSFYDTTLSVDGSQCALLTTQRLIFWTKDGLTQMAIDDITELSHRDEPLIGDVITAIDGRGQQLKFEIAPLNDGASFVQALERVTGLRMNAGATKRGAPDAPPAAADEPGPEHAVPAETPPPARKRRR